MSIASGLPRPKLWIVPDDDPNAFATGRDPAHASIAVTEGLLTRLDRDELQAVVAHEMAHVARYDTRLMTLVAAMVGAIALLSDGLGRFLWHSGRSEQHGRALDGWRRRSTERRPQRRRCRGAGGGVGADAADRPARLTPGGDGHLAQREFLADATAAQYTRNPGALASALAKLDDASAPTHRIGRAATHLCIVDPGDQRVQRLRGALGNLMASHPPMAERIARLQAMG